MCSETYNDKLQMIKRLQSIGTNHPDNDSLDILELFAQKDSLTIADITGTIKSTEIERVYKNVHGKVQKLESSKLIVEDTEVDKTKRRHNEKYYKLTDDGIYRLFLNRPYGILADQLSVKKGHIPVSNFATFLRHYGNNLVFELFLYPYFEKSTISADDFDLIVKLFHYVHRCCKQLDAAMRAGRHAIPQFSWNKVPGEDQEEMLASLKKVFSLDELNKDNVHIKKNRDNSRIEVVSAPEVHIELKLDLPGSKAVATLDVGDRKNIKEYEYHMANLFSESTACIIRPSEDLIEDALDTRGLVEVPTYELVSEIGRANSVEDYEGVLAHDERFMKLLEGMHHDFEEGYRRLIKIWERS